MSGPVEVKVELDDTAVEELARALMRRGKRPPLRRVAVIAQRSVLRNFREEGRPTRWKPLRPNAKNYRHGKAIDRTGGKILQDQGRLRDDTATRYSRSMEFAFYSKVDYAAPHQYGFKKLNIPARPFMLWQDEDVRQITEMFADHLTKRGRR